MKADLVLLIHRARYEDAALMLSMFPDSSSDGKASPAIAIFETYPKITSCPEMKSFHTWFLEKYGHMAVRVDVPVEQSQNDGESWYFLQF